MNDIRSLQPMVQITFEDFDPVLRTDLRFKAFLSCSGDQV